MAVPIKKVSLSIIGLFLLSLIFSTQALAEPYGWSPNVDNSWGGPPRCTDAKPKAPILYQPNHLALPRATGKGQVRLQWTKVPGAQNYSVFYGLSPHNYIYSAADVGDTDNFTVGYLGSRTYYFAVLAKAGCAAGALSNEWTGRPGGGGYGLGGTGYGYTPVVRTTVPETIPEPTVVPGTGSNVQGVSDEAIPTEAIVVPTYEREPYVPPTTAPVVQPTPKPLSFWQKILNIFFRR